MRTPNERKILALEQKISKLETSLHCYKTGFHMLQSEIGRALNLFVLPDDIQELPGAVEEAQKELSHAIWRANRELF